MRKDVSPDVSEVPYDGIDNDCDESTLDMILIVMVMVFLLVIVMMKMS